MVNLKIRDEISKNRIKMWEIAEKMGITDSSLSRKFRRELTEREKNKIRNIITEIKAGESHAE